MPDLIIQAPRQGIAPSPHLGFGDVRNLDIFSVPGVVKINNLTTKLSGTTITGSPKWIIRDPLRPSDVWVLDDDDNVYKGTSAGTYWKQITGHTAGSGYGEGIAIWNDYLFKADAALLDIYGPLSGTTGTGTISSSGTAVTGVGTSFDTELVVGDSIWIGTNTNATLIRFVTVITDATHMTINAAPATAYAGDAFKYAHWTKNWQVIDSETNNHPMFVSKNDGKLYGGAGKYIFSIEELTTFDPATAATYAFTKQALDLPSDYIITCLAEQGNNLMIGTNIGGSNGYFYKTADIFPWDRSSPSFGQPICLEENGVSAMITVNSILYILAGIEGKIFSSNGVQTSLIAQIPISVANIEGGNYIRFYPGSICVYKGRIFFGVGKDFTDVTIGGIGVWSLLPTSKGNILTFEHQISTGNSGLDGRVEVEALCPLRRDYLLIGWEDIGNTAQGIDAVSQTSRYTSYAAYFESPMYPVGTNLHPRPFQEIEFQLARPLRTNEGIKVDYRVNITDDFTNLGTYDYSTFGAILSKNFVLSRPVEKIPACEQIQLKIYLTGTTTSPELKNIILR